MKDPQEFHSTCSQWRGCLVCADIQQENCGQIARKTNLGETRFSQVQLPSCHDPALLF